MPMYDRTGTLCSHRMIDCWEPVEMPVDVPCPECGGPTVRAWLSKPAAVIGDECDITIKHGLCDANGNPVRYRSKAEIARVAKERNLSNRVEHIGAQGSDKSKHTARWV